MTAVRTSRVRRSYVRSRRMILAPRKLKARLHPRVRTVRARGSQRRLQARTRDPDPHLAGRA